jgi:MoxR-like ATPase
MDVLRLPAERLHAEELRALGALDEEAPPGWRLSPRAVRTFVLGSQGRPLDWSDETGEARQTVVTRKLYGCDALVERAIVSLASDRGLLLVGEPGTAKSWLAEHLAAAISGSSLLTVQGSAGLTEDQVRYTWNYALLLAEGPSERALVPGPLLTGMREGRLVRFEELTRATPEVQDVLLSALSDKVLTIPELPGDAGVVLARRGFNVVATANTRDRGVSEMSAALKRRFAFETVPPIDELQVEVAVVRQQVEAWLAAAPPPKPVTLGDDVLDLLVTTFHEVRSGRTLDGVKVERGPATLSTAEAVGVAVQASLHASWFADGRVQPSHVVQHLPGVAVRDAPEARAALLQYFDTAVRQRAVAEIGAWKAYYAARTHLT